MTFPEYLYFLLPSALKKVGKKTSGWWVLCTVLGRRAQRLKDTILSIREQTMILTCSEELLPVFGQERDMPRLKGETAKQYRRRLSLKTEIAEKAGTITGILLALSALGYGHSRIEPFHTIDPERWAEFLVYLEDDGSGVKDLQVIDGEVAKVKQASSLPAYAGETNRTIEIYSQPQRGYTYIPLCNMVTCGTYPELQGTGSSFPSEIHAKSQNPFVTFDLPLSGDTAASAGAYVQYRTGEGVGTSSELEARSSIEIQPG